MGNEFRSNVEAILSDALGYNAAELVEGGAGFEQLGQICRLGPSLQRTVPHGRLLRRDEVDERVGGHDC